MNNRMYIARCPLRVGLSSAGGADYPEYYKEYGGLVISMAIDKYSYVTMRPCPDIFDHLTRVQYSKVEEVLDNSHIEHNGVRGVLEYLKDYSGYEINYLGDLPARSGLAASSSFICAMLKLIWSANDVDHDNVKIAEACNSIERDLLQEPGGHQDPYGCTIPGIKRISFTSNGIECAPFKIDEDHLLSRCVLLYTGKARYSYQTAASYSGKESLEYKHEIQKLTREISGALDYEDFNEFGLLLDRVWKNKQKISDMVSNEHINTLYDTGLGKSAIGGRLVGAGMAGFLFFVLEDGVDPDKFAQDMCLHRVKFGIDHEGAKIVL